MFVTLTRVQHIHICRPSSTAAFVGCDVSGVVKWLQVHAVVSKMMMEEGFAGSWDQPTRSVVMHNAQPSRLQTLASELSDRAAGEVLGFVAAAAAYNSAYS